MNAPFYFNKNFFSASLLPCLLLLTLLLCAKESSAQACKFSSDTSCSDNLTMTWGFTAVTLCLNTPDNQNVNYNCSWQDGTAHLSGSSPGGWATTPANANRYKGTLTCNVTGAVTCSASIQLIPAAGYTGTANPPAPGPGMNCQMQWAFTGTNPLIMYNGNSVPDACGKYARLSASPVRNAASGQATVTCTNGATYTANSPDLTFPIANDGYDSPWMLFSSGDTIQCTITQQGVSSPLGPNLATCTTGIVNFVSGTCGNGIVETCTEDCDEGALNGTPGHCNSTCSGSITKCLGPFNFGPWDNVVLKDGTQASPTRIRAKHFTEIQERIDKLRKDAGLGVFNWTGCGFNATAGEPITAKLITCPRTAIKDVYTQCDTIRSAVNPFTLWQSATSNINWEDSTINGSTPIRKKHVEQLRQAVDQAW